MINVKLEKIVALQTGKIKSLYCRCVEPVGYLKMNKSVANAHWSTQDWKSLQKHVFIW